LAGLFSIADPFFDSARNATMNPTVAVVAQGAMGAGVGGRLVERGNLDHVI
jgi:hypothetical protein